MSAPAQRLALACEYLAHIVQSIDTPWFVNDRMVSLWNGGALDRALQSLRMGDAKQATAHLLEAAELAAVPVPTGERHAMEAQAERDGIALAAKVARALLTDRTGTEGGAA